MIIWVGSSPAFGLSSCRVCDFPVLTAIMPAFLLVKGFLSNDRSWKLTVFLGLWFNEAPSSLLQMLGGGVLARLQWPVVGFSRVVVHSHVNRLPRRAIVTPNE